MIEANVYIIILVVLSFVVSPHYLLIAVLGIHS